MYMCILYHKISICMYIYIYIYVQILLNIIDILYLHIFFFIHKSNPPNTIKVIREFERIQKKICRHKISIMFNKICINEEMLPKYTYFKLHDPAAHKYNSTLEYRRDLVKRQITLCKNNGKDALTQ